MNNLEIGKYYLAVWKKTKQKVTIFIVDEYKTTVIFTKGDGKKFYYNLLELGCIEDFEIIGQTLISILPPSILKKCSEITQQYYQEYNSCGCRESHAMAEGIETGFDLCFQEMGDMYETVLEFYEWFRQNYSQNECGCDCDNYPEGPAYHCPKCKFLDNMKIIFENMFKDKK